MFAIAAKSLKVFAAAILGVIPTMVLAPVPVLAAGAGDLLGRWAINEGDCVANRYVWWFAADRAALVIDNVPIGGWQDARYRVEAEDIQLSLGDGRRIAQWHVVAADEIALVTFKDGARALPSHQFGSWHRCPGR